MRYLLPVLLLFSFTAHAQTAAWPTVKWQSVGPEFDSALLEGREVKAARFDNTTVAVLMDDSGDYLAFLVNIQNKSTHRIIVNPGSASVKIQTPSPQLLLTIPADKVAKAMEHSGRWRNVLGAFFAGMARQTSTGSITDQYGNQSTVTLSEPDYAAQQNARMAARGRNRVNQNSAAIIRDIGLRANTVFPNTDLIGWVFFEKKKFASLTVSIFTGQAMYEFPFTKLK
jgi:hypothetical protein